jgi:predicted Zn-dependent protease
MTSRLERIEAMLVDEPHDSFLRYSLALELKNAGRHDESIQKLEELTRDEPPHISAFFMAAQQLVDLDRITEARTYLRNGIEHARQQGDSHAAAEMSEYLSTLGQYGE